MGSLATSVTNNVGGYSATGTFSVEFLTRVKTANVPNIPIGEYFFLLGLTRKDHSFSYNVSVTPTYNGAQVNDNGNGISQINLSGEIYAHYSGKPVRKPMPGVAGVGNALLGELEALNPAKKSGYLDFFDLVYLMQEIRSKGTYDNKVPTFSPFYPTAFDINLAASGQMPFNAEDIQMVFHDYDIDSHWEVAFDKNGFKISQSKEDPHTWYWNLNFIGVKDVSGKSKFRIPPLPDPKQLIRDALGAFNNILTDLTGPLSFIAGLTDLYHDIATLAEDMKADLRVFETTNKASLRKIAKAGGPLKKKTNQFQELLLQLIFPNQTTPAIGALNSPINPVSTNSTQAEINAEEIPDSVLNNVLTAGQVNEAEIDAAVDPAVLFVTNLQIALGTISTALMLANNEILSQNSIFIKIQPGETLEFLANKYYGSPERIDLLIQGDPTLIGKSNDDLIGLSIKVPSSITYNQRDTGVYTNRYLFNGLSSTKSQEIIEEFLFGEDIAFSQDRDIETKAGDLATVKGIDCLVDGLLDKMKIQPGQIPVHPDIGALPNPGTVPDDFLNLVIPRRIQDDLQSDLGVKSVDIVEFTVDSDAITYVVKVNPIGEFKSFKLKRVRGLIE